MHRHHETEGLPLFNDMAHFWMSLQFLQEHTWACWNSVNVEYNNSKNLIFLYPRQSMALTRRSIGCTVCSKELKTEKCTTVSVGQSCSENETSTFLSFLFRVHRIENVSMIVLFTAYPL